VSFHCYTDNEVDEVMLSYNIVLRERPSLGYIPCERFAGALVSSS